MNLYVSNLGQKITDESLQAVFATHGLVRSTRMVPDARAGFLTAYLDMPNEHEAALAIRKIHGAIIDGQAISVEAVVGSKKDPQ